ncbi:SPOR domain-containing protein [Caenimonas koreensis DSM 17982]|uniref:SPOR domain-containing protein n=1 Tax=Caenimonas koreensis DSM 17982 TaxID=1121255 RepID=A0A844AQV8_9BURK|nr:SPOR domain-containing protein [Caenimonas koreensis]MRD46404.1 SPOR domain-containing protein [Caenimonas koreensis DSM 17982]
MAFFKFRKGGDDSQATQRPAESVEAMRKRARHRLIGAAVLVLIGVVGFPLLFDTQPRPIAVDIPIEIPDRNKVKPLPAPVQPAVVAASAASVPAAVVQAPPAAVAAAPSPAPASTPVQVAKVEPPPAKVEAKTEAKPEPKPEAKPPVKAEPKPESKPDAKAAEPKPAPKVDDGAKARALLEGKTPAAAVPAAAESGRFVVQVGAFADAALAQETRRKVEKAGLKTYTNVAETKDGKRIRVRVGPFATRDEAVRAAEKIKGLDLPAAILTL